MNIYYIPGTILSTFHIFNSFNSNNLMRWKLSSPICRWGNWGITRQKLLHGRAGIHTQILMSVQSEAFSVRCGFNQIMVFYNLARKKWTIRTKRWWTISFPFCSSPESVRAVTQFQSWCGRLITLNSKEKSHGNEKKFGIKLHWNYTY